MMQETKPAQPWLNGLVVRNLQLLTAPRAVDLFRQHQKRIRLVLCELTMPGLDGLETMAILHKLSPDLPVILTEKGNKKLQDEQLANPWELMQNPYGADKVRTVLEKMVNEEG